MQVQSIIVIFKTHLDIGYTDFASNVIKQYNEVFIPKVIAIGEEMHESGREEGYVWTSSSWVLHQYLQQAEKKERLRAYMAIERGLLRWHALPFTMHSECANADLFRYGLSLSQELDQIFGIKTIAGKCTDVPGQTRAVIPLLREAGISLLHTGVNAASTPPDVPELFRWQAPGGECINMMYSVDYGDFTVLPSGKAIFFAHTGDNLGPQPTKFIFRLYDSLRQQYPDAVIRAGDLSDAARAVAEIEGTLPVFTQEIGDTWIHGVGTDPQKMSQYRALLRLAAEWGEEPKRAMYRQLLLIPEHTWGLDEKTHLHDNSHYSRAEFEPLRRCDPRYRKMEESWREQRDYITAAIAALPSGQQALARQAIAECCPGKPDLRNYSKAESDSLTKNGWEFKFDTHGAIVKLEKNALTYADYEHKLCDFLYEAFSELQVQEFGARYLVQKFTWSNEDQGKIGLGPYMERYRPYKLHCDGIYENEQEILLLLSPDTEATALYGCPPNCCLIITPGDNRVHFDFAWFDKPALRIPEALWLGFCPTRPLAAIQKLGSMIDPLDVLPNGNREMHATEGLLQFGGISLQTLDAPLLAIGKPSVYAFHNQIPDTRKGVWVNLFNNQWGTNFPMWNEGDARFRFILKVTSEKGIQQTCN